MTTAVSGRLRQLLLPYTASQWLALHCANDVWTLAERGPSPALTGYAPTHRPAYRSLLTAAEWLQSHPHDPRAQAVTGGDFTLYMALGDDLLHWNEQGDGLWLPGVPGEMEVLEDTHGPVHLVLGESEPYMTSSGLLWVGLSVISGRP